MNRYLASGRCPDCWTSVQGHAQCPSCGLTLVGQVADDLRAALGRADTILDVLRRAPAPVRAPAPAPSAAPGPAPQRSASRRRGLTAASVPAILLGLGAICVLVAAIVFVAVTWSDLSLGWRTAILLGITGVATAAAGWSLRKALRGTAETLTLVTSGLLLIDLLAGNSAGLPVLSALDGTAFGWLLALTLLTTGLGWALVAQHTPTRSLVGQQVVAVTATVAVVGLADLGWDHGRVWLSALVAAGAAAYALGLWRLRLRIVASAAGVIALSAWVYLAVEGLGEAVAADGPAELFGDLRGAPLLVAAAGAAVAAASRRVHVLLRTIAAICAVAGVVVLALLPVRELSFTAVVLAVGVASVVLVTLGYAASTPWRDALRIVGLGTTLYPAGIAVAGAAVALVRVVDSAGDVWSRGLTDPLGALPVAAPGQLWIFIPVGGLVAAAVGTAFARRTRTLVVAVAAAAGAGALTSMLMTGWPLLVLGLVLAAGAGAGVVALVLTEERAWLVPAGALVVLGLVVALPSLAATAAFYATHGALLLVLAWSVRDALARTALARTALAGTGVAVLAVSVQAFADLAGMAPAGRGIALLVFAVAVVAVAQWLALLPQGESWRIGPEVVAVAVTAVGLAQTSQDEVLRTVGLGLVAVVTAAVAVLARDRRLLACASVVFLAGTVHEVVRLAGGEQAWRAVAVAVVAGAAALGAQVVARRSTDLLLRLGLELTSVVVAFASLAGQVEDSLALTVGLSILGSGAILVSFTAADRRRVAWAGSGLLLLASWVRLRAVDVDVVEAYTLPGAVALLVAGMVWMRRTPAATSWRALATPLGLSLGPSLLVALGEPTSLRALLVGLAGLGLVAVALVLHWGAPLLVGGTAVGLLALVNIAPYAAALERWILFGAAGVALLVLGVTWEQRRRDLAAVGRYVTRLR